MGNDDSKIPRATRAPPPIVPTTGGRGARISLFQNRPPNWDYWKWIPRPHLWELIALALNFEPKVYLYNGTAHSAILDDVPNYRLWAEIFTARAEDDFAKWANPARLERDWEIPTAHFVARAKAIGMPVASELEAIADTQPTPVVIEAPEPELAPMTPEELAETFRAYDAAQWKRMSYEAKDNGLLGAMRSEHSGRKPRTYDPEAVANWLIKARGHDRREIAHQMFAAIPPTSEFEDKAARWDRMARLGR